jgi:[ribosomal protein S5]-alanine N-acetyltransferase
MFQLTTERLILRHLDADDAPMILRLLNEESFLRNIGDRGVRSLEDARAYIQSGPVASYQQFGFGLNRVALRDDGPGIGICGLLQRPYLDHPDIGFALLPEYWSRGYAREAALAVLDDGRTRLGLRTILATTALENPESIRLLLQIGFRFDRLLQTPGYDQPSRLFVRDE